MLDKCSLNCFNLYDRYCKKTVSLLDSLAMKLLILLIGMVLILEGIPYVAAPRAMQEWLKKLSEIDPGQLRTMGLIAMGAGLLICVIVQKTSVFS